MRKKRIIFGLNDFVVGGMQRQFVEQLPFFDRQRFEIILITLFTFPGKDTLYSELPKDLEVYRLSFSGFLDLRSWYRLCLLLRQLEPDIVVSSLFFSNTVFRALKPFVGYTAIAREHNTYVHRKFIERLINRLLAALSHKIVAVSSTVAEYTAKREGIAHKKFVVIRNGINNQKMRTMLQVLPSRDALREELGFEKDELVLLCVARLTPQKNHALLLSGFALFKKEHPHSRLAIVGEGALLRHLKALAAEAGVAQSVTFFGQRHDMAKFYKTADLLVSTSYMEGMSNAYLEALAAGLPLIATKTAGTDELIEEGENGFFILEATPQGVKESLNRALARDLKKLGARAEALSTKLDIAKTVRQYEELFEKS